MLVKQDFIIDKDSPFENDLFNLEEFSTRIENVIESYKIPLVISINGDWGIGKTTFIKMWNEKLGQSQKFKSIYFNAWEYDDTDDALLALIHVLEESISTHELDYFQGAKKIATKLAKKGIPYALKIATNGFLNLDKMAFSDFMEEQITEFSGEIGKIEYQNIKTQVEMKKELIIKLSEFQMKTNKEIIIFIDELDRCRPLFAIEILERIKHIFHIDNYTFVIALQMNQLAHSVSTIYGQNMDSNGYLRRFFDIELKLPNVDRNKYFLVQKGKIGKNISLKKDTVFWEYLNLHVIKSNFSLRDIDNLFNHLAIILPNTWFCSAKEYMDNYVYVYSVLMATMLTIRFEHNNLYNNILNGNAKEEDFESYHNRKFEVRHSKYHELYYRDIIQKFISYGNQSNDNLELEIKSDYGNIIVKTFFEEHSIIRHLEYGLL